jgi:hypothetical protein
MLFYEEELANKGNFKKAVSGYLTSFYTDDVLPGYEHAIELTKFSKPLREKILATIDGLPDSSFPINEDDMPTLWIETRDAFEMVDEGDFSGIQSVLEELLNWLIQLNPKK